MKVNILKWHGVASWTWDAHDDACGICRMAFDGCCPDCKMPGDDCPLSSFTNPPLLIFSFLHLFAFAHFVDISTTQCLHLSLYNAARKSGVGGVLFLDVENSIVFCKTLWFNLIQLVDALNDPCS
jgi:hypothetical protein